MTNYTKCMVENTTKKLYKSAPGGHRHNTRSVKPQKSYKYTHRDFDELVEVLQIESQISGIDEKMSSKISSIYEYLRDDGFISDYLNLYPNKGVYGPGILFKFGVDMAKTIRVIKTCRSRQKKISVHKKRILNVIFIRSFSRIESNHKDYSVFQDLDVLLTDMICKLDIISTMFGLVPI